MTLKEEKGFIALISAIIISISLLTLVTAASFSGFFGRFSILDSEIKESSNFLAEACVNIAILKLSQNENHNFSLEDKTKKIGDAYCDIVSVTQDSFPLPWPQTIRTQATSSKGVFTNLEVQVNDLAGDIVIFSWKEVPEF